MSDEWMSKPTVQTLINMSAIFSIAWGWEEWGMGVCGEGVEGGGARDEVEATEVYFLLPQTSSQSLFS